jgi:uroporphyrinogen-III synthase
VRSETVIVTRPQGDTFAQSLEARGFKTIIMPLFSLEPRELEPQDKVLLSDLKSYEWLIFTSQYGVRYAHQLLRDSLPITLRVAVIGKKTALAYTNYFNKNADFIGTGQSSEQFAEQFAAQLSPASRIILFTVLEHRGVFTKIVQERGFVIEEFAIYQQVPLALNGEQIKLIKSEQRELLLWPFLVLRLCVRVYSSEKICSL